MASNGLVANPSKTTLMILSVGNKIIHKESSSKLLGVQIHESETWKTQINEKGGVIPSLKQRLYLIKRLKNQVNKERLRKIADSIWTSKIRYGLQLYGQVRLSYEDKKTND